MRKVGIDLDVEELDELMKVIDADGDGDIDLDDFLSAASPAPRKATFVDGQTSGGSAGGGGLSGTLKVRAVRCSNLLARNLNSSGSDPLVKMSLGQGSSKQEWKSKVQPKTTDPHFTDGWAVFYVNDDGSTSSSNALSTLVVQVAHWSMLGDKLLGEVDVDLRREFGDTWSNEKQRKRHTWTLADYDSAIKLDARRRRMGTDAYGSIELEIEFTPATGTNRGSTGSASGVEDGKAIIQIACCKDLTPMDTNGLSDPYAKVELLQGQNYADIQSFSTKPVLKTLNPVFTDNPQSLRMDYQSFKDGKCWLRVSVYDKDKVGTDDFEGLIQIDLRDYFSHKWTTGKVQQMRTYLFRGICLHSKSHNFHLTLGLNYPYIFPGVGMTYALTDPEDTIPAKKVRPKSVAANPYGTVEVNIDFHGEY